ncbi:hypothetical protein A7U60_g7649 [Sanghuangporus baumii]|uniref:Uncharacterized protein n=1 Tax=Sanghuangporus baumii TaxID=108892 RepID=A0A9Q5HST1_SANBA|nr:hypothetical protein A7U60_g7649 [Sanghuangporus baumii]
MSRFLALLREVFRSCLGKRKVKPSDIESQREDSKNTQDTSKTARSPDSSQTNSYQNERSSTGNDISPSDGNTKQNLLNIEGEARPAGSGIGIDAQSISRPENDELTGLLISERYNAMINAAPSPSTAVMGITVDSNIFGNEIARRTFLEKNDDYSENEVITLCKSLNGRINHLSGHLIREKNRMRVLLQDKQQAETRNPANGNEAIPELVRKVLGKRLVDELTNNKMNTRSSTAVDHSIRDGLDAWSISCVYLAMKPVLFGLKLRNDEEIKRICNSMADKEPELAQCWNLIKDYDTPRRVDQGTKTLEDIGKLQHVPPKDVGKLEYAVLQEIYERTITGVGPKCPLQVPLHWGALLHAHEFGLESYKTAISQTDRFLQEGLREVFAVAGAERPEISNNANLAGMTLNIVKDAATLAKYTKTAVFSQNTEVVMVEPETEYDKKYMKSADELDKGKVKCTIKFGLRATDTDGNEKWLLKTEVLLT